MNLMLSSCSVSVAPSAIKSTVTSYIIPKYLKPMRILSLLDRSFTCFSAKNFHFKSHIVPVSLVKSYVPVYISRCSNQTSAGRAVHSTRITCLFTGIVEEMGKIEHLGPSKDGGFDMKISARTVLGGVKLGDSIAINGTCLTVTHFDLDTCDFTVGLSPETLRKTSLNELQPGSPVNLERALLPDTRMGGHFVQGHVDGTGEIVSKTPEGDSLWIKVRTSPELLRLIVPKGFIAVDGTSLTVVNVYEDEDCFDFMLVAYTQKEVVIPLKEVGDKVNLETDILGKYIERLLKSKSGDS